MNLIIAILFIIFVMYIVELWQRKPIEKVNLKVGDKEYNYTNATKSIVGDRLRVMRKGKVIADFPLSQVTLIYSAN